MLSVVIPVYKANPQFFDLLGGLANQKTDFPFEVLVVDDASPDDTARRIGKFLEESKSSSIRFFSMEKNLGPAGARNFAVSQARTEAFLFIDADCQILSENFISRFYQRHLGAPEAILGGGVNGIGKGPVAFFDRYCHWATNIPNKTAPVRSGHLVTANMLIPRRIYERIGPLDASLRTGEDTAFCFKALKDGIELRLEGDLQVNHQDRETWGDFMSCLYRVGCDRAASRKSALGEAPWFLAGPKFLRWLLVLPIACALTVRNFLTWFRYDTKVLFALPGIFLGMCAMAVGVAVGRDFSKSF